jgi:hypothetical protein
VAEGGGLETVQVLLWRGVAAEGWPGLASIVGWWNSSRTLKWPRVGSRMRPENITVAVVCVCV